MIDGILNQYSLNSWIGTNNMGIKLFESFYKEFNFNND